MNVENRKLFANRDARKRLAEMGGILASSPELMGEAMKFANGGGGELSYIVSNIPGLVAQYEYVRVDVPTMQMLNDRFPQLMQQATVEEESMAPSAVRTRARPQTILGTRIGRMMETQQAAPEEVVLESAPITSGEQPSLMDRIRTTVQSAQSVNPIEDAFKEIGPAITSAIPGLSQYKGQPNPYVEALKNAGLSEDALLTGSVTPSEELMSMGPMEMERLSKQPILQQELAKAVLSQQSEVPSAEDLMAGPIYPAEERSSDKNARQRAISELGLTPITRNGKEYFISPAGMVFKRKGEDLVPVDTAEAMQAMDVAQQQGKDFTKSPIGMIPIGTRDVDPSTGLVDPDAPLKRPDADISGTRTPQFLTKALGPDSAVSDLLSVQEGARRPQEMADAEREQMTGMPDLAAPEKVDVDALLEAAKENNPAAVTEALKKRFMDRDSDIVPSTVDQLTKEPPKGDPDDDKPDAPKTRKQRMLETVDMISEMFGIREKDKAEDMYDLMATIGFAMASGESPNAMKNIADAFLVGAQMKRADKKEAKADERAIQKLAYQTIQDQDATAAEQKAARDLLKEKYGYLEDLEKLKAELNPESQMSKAPSLQKAILDAIGDAAQAKGAVLTEDEIQNVTDMVIRLYQGNYKTGTDSGKTPGQAQSLKDIP